MNAKNQRLSSVLIRQIGLWTAVVLMLLTLASSSWAQSESGDVAEEVIGIILNEMGSNSDSSGPYVYGSNRTTSYQTCSQCGRRYPSEYQYCPFDGTSLRRGGNLNYDRPVLILGDDTREGYHSLQRVAMDAGVDTVYMGLRDSSSRRGRNNRGGDEFRTNFDPQDYAGIFCTVHLDEDYSEEMRMIRQAVTDYGCRVIFHVVGPSNRALEREFDVAFERANWPSGTDRTGFDGGYLLNLLEDLTIIGENEYGLDDVSSAYRQKTYHGITVGAGREWGRGSIVFLALPVDFAYDSQVYQGDNEHAAMRLLAWIAAAEVVGGNYDYDDDYDDDIDNPVMLGISARDLSNSDRNRYDYDGYGGVLVSEVWRDYPGDEAGMREDDIITRFDGQRVRDVEHLGDLLDDVDRNSTVRVVVYRRGDYRNLNVRFNYNTILDNIPIH
ncbi:MAG: PDZ domain-containing protein [Sedimentisphaerales bacterium]|nr:PDZ domain-containing protein [Sedimentisphaerales bacterium]